MIKCTILRALHLPYTPLCNVQEHPKFLLTSLGNKKASATGKSNGLKTLTLVMVPVWPLALGSGYCVSGIPAWCSSFQSKGPIPQRYTLMGAATPLLCCFTTAIWMLPPQVQSLLRASGRRDVDVEIVFPVNPSAITTAQQQTSSRSSSRSESSNGASSSNSDGSDGSIHAVGGVELPTGLSVLPGPAMGEGCSLEGGCASCPYMRMNTLAALHTVCGMVEGGPEAQAALEAYKPKLYEQRLVEAGPAGAGEGSAQGRSIAQAGCTSILHMQDFQKGKRFSDKLVADIKARNAAAVQR
eukprot:1159584-Pelagomonas_calceolata.AAC.19